MVVTRGAIEGATRDLMTGMKRVADMVREVIAWWVSDSGRVDVKMYGLRNVVILSSLQKKIFLWGICLLGVFCTQ